jgi:hypothetical protein
MTDNRAILRLLILLVAVTTGLTIYASYRLEQTLPAPLIAFIHTRDNAEISTPDGIAATLTMLLWVTLLAGLFGMWWCRPWARWAFTVAALAQPVLMMVVGWTDPASLIFNAVAGGANTASDMSVGATLAMVWLVMEADFTPGTGRRSTA